MSLNPKLASCLILLVLSAVGASTRQESVVADLRQAFGHPPEDSKIMMRWWWFGPAVTRAELDREMRLMKEGGIGGFEVQPVYALALDDPVTGIRNLPFLSDDFIDALRFTSRRAREIGLRMDLTLGSGWPYGGPHILIRQAAGRLRYERVPVPVGARRVPVPNITDGESLVAAYVTRANDGNAIPASLREVKDIRDGILWLPENLAGRPEVALFFIASRTGMEVKRPAVGAEGFVLDHYDRSALETHLKQVGDRLMQAFDGVPPRAIFCDSLEVYGSDWTSDFPEQFLKRRGYDIRPYLPALVANLGEKTAGVRADWGRTLTELADERFLAPLDEWAKRHRTLLRVQSYGLPPVELSSYARVDVPEGEGVQWRALSATRWASSAGHLYGRPVISSETWTWLHSPSFRATPLDVKAEADLHFLQGINQLVGHGWPYSPPGAEYPGWRFYAAGVFNEKNPWWLVMPDVALYLQRISFVLRQGRPANDVAIYLSNSDGWAHLTPGRVNLREAQANLIGPDVIPRVLDAGYGFDFIDDGAIERLGRVNEGALAVGANRYRVVILPNVERIPVAILRILAEFVRSGGTLIATRRKPALPPGLMASKAERDEIREISRRMFEGPRAARFVANENIGLVQELAAALHPDVTMAPAAPEIGFVHRSTSDAEIYFLANTGNSARSVRATFRVTGLEPEWWDPLSGEIETAYVIERSEKGVTLILNLAPYGSRILVFSKAPQAARVTPKSANADASIDLNGGWTVTIDSKTIHIDRLRSWTDDEDTRYYSGVATYKKDVNLPAAMLAPGAEIRLDFGEARILPAAPPGGRYQALLDSPVREAAVVYVNGERAGSVWCPPYSVDVTRLVKPGANRIKILVGNLAVNYMAGRPQPNYRLLYRRYGERFSPQDTENLRPVPAGLLGPVMLRSR